MKLKCVLVKQFWSAINLTSPTIFSVEVSNDNRVTRYEKSNLHFIDIDVM